MPLDYLFGVHLQGRQNVPHPGGRVESLGGRHLSGVDENRLKDDHVTPQRERNPAGNLVRPAAWTL